MMTPTHIAFSVALTSITLGTANPEILGVAALASLCPDIDTSKSLIGRLFFPISRWLESHTIHRGITHSFFASGVVILVSYPLALNGYSHIWQGLILGYFFGWFGDVFTKSGVQAFYPSRGRMIIPRNPRLRLGTRSNAEWFLLMVLVAIATLSININSNGGIIRGFNQAIGLPSGAIFTTQEDASRYLLIAQIKGRNALTELPVDESYEVVEPLTANDLLVKNKQGIVYRVGSSQECQIIATQIRIERLSPITVEVKDLILEEDDLYSFLTQLPQERTYLSGTLTVHDAEDLMLPSHIDRFDTITLQPGELAYARLVAASPSSAIATLGDYSVSGNLIVRTVYVQQKT
ncbi:metal-dependent hydrolase [Aphanothece hegewaldii CCALA 016]|uniref:Metal-dependent hydrolase n=1 Tax=Aphanothece hegewaldii CCALA 016 TaxID=2107694 RepID=A0A2T1LTD8_9CHRO|nr:metal-dependent hydrolase [Aphanothece hegewaldii]PSF33910.1 metal-dependent hydrolase [Aphanothece hegewaldii CCALA 016]